MEVASENGVTTAPDTELQKVSLEPEEDESEEVVSDRHNEEEERNEYGGDETSTAHPGDDDHTGEADEHANDDAHSVDKEQTSAPAAHLSVLRPTLRGTFDSEAGTWIGEWAMSDQEFENGVRGKFEYTRSPNKPDVDVGKPPVVEGQPEDVFVSGYFTLQLLNNPNQTIPKRENDILIRFVATPEGSIVVQGSGKNEFGAFSLSGTYTPETRQLSVYRAYQPRPVDTSKKSKKKAPGTPASAPPRKTPRSAPKAPIAWEGAMAAGPAAAVNQRVRRPPMHVVELGEEESRVRARMQSLVDILLTMDRNRFFHQPVDPVRDGVPMYLDIIKNPMDLGTVKKKLLTGAYKTEEEVAEEINLTFSNAMTFNPIDNIVHLEAKRLLAKFGDEFQKVLTKRELELEKKRKAQAAAIPASNKNGKRTKVSRQSSSGRSDPDYSEDESVTSAPRKSTADNAREDELRLLREQVQRLTSLVQEKFISEPTSARNLHGDPAYTAPVRKRSRAPAKPKPAPRMDVDLDDEDDEEYGAKPTVAPRAPRQERPLTYQEKRALGEDINQLPPDKVLRVLDIIAESGNQPIGEGAEEVEIDIEKLDTATLKALQKYVREAMREVKKNAQ